MKSIEEVIATINNKIEEHKIEIAGSDKMILDIQLSIKSKTNRPEFDSVVRLGVLKDKIIFHRSIVSAFNDLLEDIK